MSKDRDALEAEAARIMAMGDKEFAEFVGGSEEVAKLAEQGRQAIERGLRKARGESFMNTPRTDGEPRPSNGGEAGPDAARNDPVIQARPESA